MLNIKQNLNSEIGRAGTGFRKARSFQGLVRRLILVKAGLSDWDTLRMWSRVILKDPWKCSADRMGKLVARHDPHLALACLQDASIIGGGFGDHNLNAYRCGTLDGVRVFEKIYLMNSEAWRRLEWANDSILPRLAGRVTTPRLLHRVTGRRLAALYFEYLPGVTRHSAAAMPDRVRWFRQQVADLDMSGVDPALADFRTDSNYATCAARLRAILSARGHDPAGVDMLAEAFLAPDTRRVFTHGDLTPGNITPGGAILDWDKCGAYPPGYEFGAALGRSVHCDDLNEFDAVVTNDILRACDASSGSLEFFAAVFYCLRTRVRVSDDLIVALFDRALIRWQLNGQTRRTG